MARVYDIAVAALALGVGRKWLDNLTAQHTIPGTEHFARGVPRRLSMRTLVTAALVRDLNRELGVPVARAVQLAIRFIGGSAMQVADGGADHAASVHRGLVAKGAAAATRVGSAIRLDVDVAGLERQIEASLLSAMETAVPRRRGRPPRKERRGTRQGAPFGIEREARVTERPPG
jgi:hypothetical protein